MIKKCIGCGAILQKDNKNHDGYILDINNDICERCFRIKNYNEYKKTSKNNDDYLKILNSINKEDLVLYVTSLFDIRLDFIESFKNVIVVLTKKDLLPKSVKDYKLINYIKNKYNPLDIEVISSIKNYNLDNLFNKIKKYNITNNVYVIGTTNGGKSTLINKLIKNYSDSKLEITSSLYPSTTLDKIEINIDNIKIIDTPGLINEKSIINFIDNKTLKSITPKKEIKPRTYQLKGNGSILIDNLVRLDYETIDTSMTIYIDNNVKVTFLGKENDKFYDKTKYNFNLEKNKDIVISDLCFIKFTNEIKLNIYTFDNVLIYERDNLI